MRRNADAWATISVAHSLGIASLLLLLLLSLLPVSPFAQTEQNNMLGGGGGGGGISATFDQRKTKAFNLGSWFCPWPGFVTPNNVQTHALLVVPSTSSHPIVLVSFFLNLTSSIPHLKQQSWQKKKKKKKRKPMKKPPRPLKA